MAVEFTARAAGVLRAEAARAHLAESRREVENALRDLCSVNGAMPASRQLREVVSLIKDVHEA